MHRYLYTFVLCLFLSHIAAAQFVTIPDPCLRDQLKSKFPACFNASNQMDTTCTAILSATILNVNDCLGTADPEVENVLKYFKSLQSLTLEYGDDEDEEFGVGGGVLIFAEAPATLRTLNLIGLSAFDWPDADWDIVNIPNTIETLKVSGTLMRLNRWPAALKKLEIIGDEGASARIELPDNAFHPGIEEIDFARVDLTRNYDAPTQLKKMTWVFVADANNQLSYFLSTLPDGVEYIDLDFLNDGETEVVRLPANLPAQLKYLSVQLTALTNDPLNLPNQLTYLLLENKPGPLSALPASLEELRLYGCNISNPEVTFSSAIPNLKHFETDFMLMPVLPVLPQGLGVFSVSRGGLNELPPLPSSVFRLIAPINNIVNVNALPPGLVNLNLQSNKLLALPPLPRTLRTLDVSRNPDLACLPPLPDSLQQLNFVGAQFNCIPNTTVFINATPNRPLCTDSSRICADDQPIFEGKVFLDVNKNGVFDGPDQPLRNTIVQLQGSSRFATTKTDGSYRLLGDRGIANTFFSTYSNPYLQQISPASRTLTPTAGGVVADTFNFAVRLEEVQDLEVNIANIVARPGFTTSAWVTVTNRGGVNVDNASLQFVYPPTWTFFGATPAQSAQTGDTLVWTGLDLPIGSSQTFQIQTQLPPTATILGNPYTYWARILPVQNDQTPNNNVALRIDTIRGAYDPNDKLVDRATLAPGYGPDTELFYTIRFQNTGTDTAFNVVLTDTILSKLKPESIRVISASHDFDFELKEGGIAVFTFENIMLPDSNVNEPASHGFVLLALKPLAGLAENAGIENSAAIFFDFNEPIITNIATTQVKVISSTVLNVLNNVLVYPNPTGSSIRVSWEAEGQAVLSLFDLAGRHLQSSTVETSFAEIDLSAYASGTYLLQIEVNGRVNIAKVQVLR